MKTASQFRRSGRLAEKAEYRLSWRQSSSLSLRHEAPAPTKAQPATANSTCDEAAEVTERQLDCRTFLISRGCNGYRDHLSGLAHTGPVQPRRVFFQWLRLGAIPAARKWNERPGQFVIVGGNLREADRAR
jgi:hypothetical protein